MLQVRWMCAGLCLLAVAAPAMAQRGQYDNRGDAGARDGQYGRDGGDRGNNGYDRGRDGGPRDDRYGNDRNGNDRNGNGRYGNDRRAGALPGGSWSQSCRRSSMSGNTLNAQCKDQRGKWRDTQINPRRCQTGRVGNRFGTLSCE